MKKLLLSFLTILSLSATLQAQDASLVSAVTAATPATLLTGGKYTITSLKFVNANTTNSGQFWFYDTPSNATNIIRPAFTSYTSYATNFTTTFTNSAGIIVSNIWAGTYRQSVANAAATNEAPKIIGPFVIPVSSVTEIDPVNVMPYVGATVYSTVAGTLETQYRITYP